MHNPLIRQFDWCLHALTSLFPTIYISNSTLETNPPIQPEVIMDPVIFQSEVNQEDYRHFRLPVAYIQDQFQHWQVLSHSDHEVEPLLFPVLYPWG